MKAPSRLLAQTGIVVAVAAAILGVSVSQASAFSSPETPERLTKVGLGQPSPDEPIETQIEQAIEDVNQEGQDALEELGELDTPEKADRAEQIMQHLERTSYEIKKRAHDRASDRFEELNDLAIGRLGDETRAELRDLGDGNSPEKQARAEAIRTRNALKKAQLEARLEDRRQRVAQRQSEQELPKADFRLPNGRPPLFAIANGLRLRLAKLTEEQANNAIAQLEQESQANPEGLGELDTPGKVQRARKMRARLAERLQDLRHRVAQQKRDAVGDQYKERAQELQHRAEVAINDLGELDSPEKQEQARQINAKLEEALAALRDRVSNVADRTFEERLDRETQSFRHRTDAALQELGELDTPERQEKARRIKVRFAEQVRKLRAQLARRSAAAFDEGFDQDSDGLQRDTEVALKKLGRLDTPEKVREAQLIRVRMKEAINRLKNQQGHRLNDKSGPSSDALTDFLDNRGRGNAADRIADWMDGNMPADLRHRAERARQAQQKAKTVLRQQRDAQTKIDDRETADQERARARARQVIRANQDRPHSGPEREVEPTVPPEPREVEPVGQDSTPDSDSSGSNSGRN